MSQIKCLIVDDEEIARQRMNKLVSVFPELEIIGEAENGREALEKINALNPDLVFLDIQMPELNGFEVLKKLSRQPVIIFTTAFDTFAIRAFDENAVAYLLKPIDADKLKRAIEKSKLLLQKAETSVYDKLLQFVEKKTFTQFVSKFGAKIKLIPKEEVCYISAKDKHTFIHLHNQDEYIVDHTLNELDTIIDDSFLRIHRSLIISLVFINEVEKEGDGRYLFTLKDSKRTQLLSSTGYSAKIRNALGL